MNKLLLSLVVSLFAVPAFADNYVRSDSKEIVKNSFNECWVDGNFTGKHIPECGGKVEELPVVKKVELEVARPIINEYYQEVKTAVYFNFDSSDIREEDKVALNKLINMKTEEFEVIGYTDYLGSDEYNNKLSMKRAEVVKSYLVSMGVPASKIKTKWVGENASDPSTCEVKNKKAKKDCLLKDRKAIVINSVLVRQEI